jgi:villin 1/advillin
VDEIFRFSQRDLNEQDIMILDAVYEIFVWEGAHASVAEKDRAMQVAQDYLAVATDGRPSDVPITVIQSKQEPLTFKCHFHGWSNKLGVSTLTVVCTYIELGLCGSTGK